jgi:hypothetical protein
MKPTKMSDVSIGDTVFLRENLSDELRETYYTRTGPTIYRHHGCVQGSVEREEGERPRYVNLSVEGFEYPLVGALPVFPIEASAFNVFKPRVA